jgi:hypothetical protein
MGGKFYFFAQGSDFAPFVGNGTKIKICYEIKLPLFIFLLGFFINIEKRYKIAKQTTGTLQITSCKFCGLPFGHYGLVDF